MSDNGPLFSIIIPVKGRLAHLRESLPAACTQPNSETIVVDYDCPEGSGKWAREHWPQAMVVSVFPQPIFNLSRARNLGAATARGLWLVFLDVDVVLRPDFAEGFARVVRAGEFYVTACRDHGFGGFIVAEREAFRRAGGADPRFTGWGHEDDDTLMALKAGGGEGRSIDVRFIGRHLDHGDEERMRFYGGAARKQTHAANARRFAEKWGVPAHETIVRQRWPVVDATRLSPARPAEAFAGHRLGMRRLFLPETDAFNGALLQTPRGRLLVYRAPPACACVFLDEQLAVIPGTHHPLDLWRNDDPRLAQCGNRIYLSTSYHGGGMRNERIELRELSFGGTGVRLKLIGKFETIEADPAYVRVREKNWAPFEHEGRLLYVHKAQPHRILEVDRARGAVRLIHETPWSLPEPWPVEWGRDLRLNAPPVRLDAQRYLSTLHTWHRRGYRTWFYSFASGPPFDVLEIGQSPVILPEDAVDRNPRNHRHRCVFITGLQIDRERGEVLLSGGNNDSAVVVLRMSLASVTSHLMPAGGALAIAPESREESALASA